jgi:plastocyanin
VPSAAQQAAAATLQAKIIEPSATNYLGWTYAPDTLTVHLGDHVVWTNIGQAAHTVTADGGAFDSGSLNTHQTWTFVFSKVGTYAYHCTFHPWMKGTVTVVQ